MIICSFCVFLFFCFYESFSFQFFVFGNLTFFVIKYLCVWCLLTMFLVFVSVLHLLQILNFYIIWKIKIQLLVNISEIFSKLLWIFCYFWFFFLLPYSNIECWYCCYLNLIRKYLCIVTKIMLLIAQKHKERVCKQKLTF